MKPILYIVAIVAIGGAAYFSLQNANNFKNQQGIRLKAKDDNDIVTGKAVVKNGELDTERGVLKSAKDQEFEAQQSIDTLKSSEVTLKRDAGEIEATLTAQKADLASLEKTIAEIKQVLAELGPDVDLDNFADKLIEIDATKTDLERELEDKETLVSAAEKRLSNNKSEASRLVDKKIERNARIGRNANESVITAVSQDWGFVVIGAGASTGFTPQSTLLVKRDGRLIGRVLPSAIERSQTVANVILESIAPGVRLQPGDRVILAKPESN
ncbi:MAG: hypothetical protein RLZZ522_169 [Verrucomicrobiota bacterium]|jgi:hypothetical protein